MQSSSTKLIRIFYYQFSLILTDLYNVTCDQQVEILIILIGGLETVVSNRYINIKMPHKTVRYCSYHLDNMLV